MVEKANVPGQSVKDTSSGGKNQNGLFECENLLPQYEDCMTKGPEISHWFMERFLNPNNVCDWEKGSCNLLFP